MILMVVGALQFHMLAIEEKSFIGIETNGADTEIGMIFIHHLAIAGQGGVQLIQMWVVE